MDSHTRTYTSEASDDENKMKKILNYYDFFLRNRKLFHNRTKPATDGLERAGRRAETGTTATNTQC